MSDSVGIKPFWNDTKYGPACPTPDLSGDVASTRGTDPNTQGNPGPNGLTASPWSSGGKMTPATTDSGIDETANGVSGLPQRPARFYPSPASPPEPPTLKERNPGTIDQK